MSLRPTPRFALPSAHLSRLFADPPRDADLALRASAQRAAVRPSGVAGRATRRVRVPRRAASVGGRVAASVGPLVAVALLTIVLSGCSSLIETVPSPTPLDFGGIASELAKRGITIGNYRSGDAGCSDPTLIPTAIGFDAAGLDQAAPSHLRVYIFRDRATFERRRTDVDTCAGSWATDTATFEFIEASPYVVAGQGPWPPKFKAALREALVAAAGNGG